MFQSLPFARCAVALALMLGVSAPVSAADSQCASVAEVNAFVVRDLQSRLMVAGLACGQRVSYNAFVKAHNAELIQAGQRLVTYFREHSTGRRALDRHVTVAANEASRRHGLDRAAYCQQTAELFTALLNESKTSLVQVAQKAPLRAVKKPVVCLAKNTPDLDEQMASHQIGTTETRDGE